MNTPPPLSETVKAKLEWYEHVWVALPFALVAMGGAIGGACGGAAWAINRSVFQKTSNPFLRYVWTGLISVTAFIAYILIAGTLIALIKK